MGERLTRCAMESLFCFVVLPALLKIGLVYACHRDLRVEQVS